MKGYSKLLKFVSFKAETTNLKQFNELQPLFDYKPT